MMGLGHLKKKEDRDWKSKLLFTEFQLLITYTPKDGVYSKLFCGELKYVLYKTKSFCGLPRVWTSVFGIQRQGIKRQVN